MSSVATTLLSGVSNENDTDDRLLAEGLTGERILLPLLDKAERPIRDQISVAYPLARRLDASILVTNPVTLPEQAPYEMQPSEGSEQQLIGWALNEIESTDIPAEGTVRIGRNTTSTVLNTIAEHDIDLVVLPADSDGANAGGQSQMEKIERKATCDVIVVDATPEFSSRTRILVPLGGGPHSGLTVDVAHSLASEHDIFVEILNIIEPDPSATQRETAERLVTEAADRFTETESVQTWILEAEDIATAIIDQSDHYDLTLIGAPTKNRLRRFVFGSKSRTLQSGVQTGVLMMRKRGGGDIDSS